ncbi:hypothetical protein Ssi03_36080 [Sphaerisporangium siamense]|uniref:Cell division septum initiation protein DivIVA n=1 Tax=Sphaerisporangium siamense TaxID=795645 RepID=A0A7W7D7M2_9ACTN|nr:hypothetical protein [Sphaerisporangium siamense]MBB4701494.1 cell division septum initiation protein DivIVA [Sphaerisporangium siamense]GII85618.1 hypothetical protein Ssi03_36080 [Sphaerisporangium siamense]
MADTTDRAKDALAGVKGGATELATKAGDQAGTAASAAGAKAADLASKAGEKAGELAAKAGDRAGDLAAKMSDKAGDLAVKANGKAGELATLAGDKAGELAGRAREAMPPEVKDAADKVVAGARNRPWLAAAAAAGLLLVWRAVRRKNRK